MMLNPFRALNRKFFLTILLLSIFSLAMPAVESKSDQAKAKHPVAILLENFYDAWNLHDIDEVMSYYSKSFISGDGIDKDSYKKLTLKLWENYPDIQILNRKKSFRNQDQYSTATTVDYYIGETKLENPDFKQKGKINALSQGSWYFKKYGKDWKIESDDINFELTTVTYGSAKSLLDANYVYFSAPEQVRSGQDYSATLYFAKEEDISVSAIVEKELIKFDEDKELPEEEYQNLASNKLERLFKANNSNYNELVSATALVYKGIVEPELEGLLFISKRVNVLEKNKPIEEVKLVDKIYAETEFKEEIE